MIGFTTKARTYEDYDEHVTYHGYMDGKAWEERRIVLHCLEFTGCNYGTHD